MKIKSKLQFPIAIAIMSIAIFSMIFQGCEKEEITPKNNLPFLSIEGDLNDPITLIESNMNKAIYQEASERIYKHLSIVKGKLFCSINSGEEVGISNEIFEYMQHSFAKINKQIINEKLVIFLNNKGQISFHNTKTNNKKIIRLKSGEIENEYEYTDFTNLNLQESSELLYNWSNDILNGNIDYGGLNDHFDLQNINWGSPDSWGIARFQTNGTINGFNVLCTMLYPCYNQQDPNCYANQICTAETDRIGNDYLITVVSCTQDPIVAIRIFDYFSE